MPPPPPLHYYDRLTPRSKNPIIAAFFSEIGLTDQLGSGVKNFYKYSKPYGGEDPQFAEGDSFEISVSLKALDEIRFTSGQPQSEKAVIRAIIEHLKVSVPTRNSIIKLFEICRSSQIFGRSEVMQVCGLEKTRADELLAFILSQRLIDTVASHDKGKYRFKQFQTISSISTKGGCLS